MERIPSLLPSLLVVACLAGLGLIYERWIKKYQLRWTRFATPIRYEKPVWWSHPREMRDRVPIKGYERVFLASLIPSFVFWMFVEETILHAPLLVLFPVMDRTAWGAVIGASILQIVFVREEVWRKRKTVDGADENPWIERVSTVFAVGLCFSISTVAGYEGITHQSIWICVGVNLFGTLAIIPLCIMAILIISSITAFGAFFFNFFIRR